MFLARFNKDRIFLKSDFFKKKTGIGGAQKNAHAQTVFEFYGQFSPLLLLPKLWSRKRRTSCREKDLSKIKHLYKEWGRVEIGKRYIPALERVSTDKRKSGQSKLVRLDGLHNLD